jgi:hypothetical protein
MSVCNSKNDSHDIQYLARMRQAVKENIHLTRKEKLQLQRERNAHLKKMLDADEKSDSPTLYEVRVSIDKQLRDETQMKKEKRGRVFIAIGNEGCKTLDGLENEIKSYFPALKGAALSMSADLPHVLKDGSIFCPDDKGNPIDVEGGDPYGMFWPVHDDESVVQTFLKCSEFFTNHNNQVTAESKEPEQLIKRPLILIHVMKNTDGESAFSSPIYLEAMPNPKETTAMTMLSFYSFPPGGISDPDDFMQFLYKAWEPFHALGRVYIANEGINAQMSVPTNV